MSAEADASVPPGCSAGPSLHRACPLVHVLEDAAADRFARLIPRQLVPILPSKDGAQLRVCDLVAGHGQSRVSERDPL